MNRRSLAAVGLIGAVVSGVLRAADPLPSWNDWKNVYAAAAQPAGISLIGAEAP